MAVPGNMPTLTSTVTDVDELGASLIHNMYHLYGRYYESTSLELFTRDLSAKDQAILLFDREGNLRGFSSLAVLKETIEGHLCHIIFSGDTIIDHRYWGEQTLPFTWIRHAGKIKARDPEIPLYWLLIVKGHRTYRYLPVFSHRYYPAWSHPTPPETKAWMDQLTTMHFGEHYDPESGLLRFPRSRGQLRDRWADVPEEDLRRPEVRFFLEQNPGYANGHELVCLTELHESNLKPLARRLFIQGMNR